MLSTFREVMLSFAVFLAAAPVSLPASLDQLAERLARTAEDLAAESYRGFRERDRGNRADVQALYVVHQFAAGTALFRQMVRDRRPEAELRDAAEALRKLLRESERYGFGRRTWQEMSRMLDDISREVDGRAPGGFDSDSRVSGRVRWRGRVDDEADIHLRGDRTEVRTISGAPASGGPGQFTAPLPQRPVNVRVRKTKGRGSVDIVQQPSRTNGFTAVVRIRDPKGGSDDYEFEAIW